MVTKKRASLSPVTIQQAQCLRSWWQNADWLSLNRKAMPSVPIPQPQVDDNDCGSDDEDDEDNLVEESDGDDDNLEEVEVGAGEEVP